MFRNLEDVIDTHWDEVDVQCNYLYYTPLKTDTDLYRYLKKLPELSNYHEKQVELIAVDTAGYYYTEYGRMRGMNYLESAPERVSYISNSLTKDDSWMVFLEQLSTPITLQSGEKEITLRYFGISQSMTQLNDYFRCDAYENSNSVYVLDNNGFKLFNANDTELLEGRIHRPLSDVLSCTALPLRGQRSGLPAQAPAIPTPCWMGLSISTP